VDAGRGLAWWGDAWRLFVASPWIWIAITVLFVIIMATLAFIPLLGSLATAVLAPVLLGGVFAGCRALDRGGEPTVGTSSAAFRLAWLRSSSSASSISRGRSDRRRVHALLLGVVGWAEFPRF
jgi:hypothetical protein